MGNQQNRDGHNAEDAATLTPGTIELLEKSLREVGEFGEVHTVMQQSRIRFVRTIKSRSVNPGGSDTER